MNNIQFYDIQPSENKKSKCFKSIHTINQIVSERPKIFENKNYNIIEKRLKQ